MKDKAIGVFDSGVGGLTCAKELLKLVPNENMIYLGDTARMPYGVNSQFSPMKSPRAHSLTSLSAPLMRQNSR